MIIESKSSLNAVCINFVPIRFLFSLFGLLAISFAVSQFAAQRLPNNRLRCNIKVIN